MKVKQFLALVLAAALASGCVLRRAAPRLIQEVPPTDILPAVLAVTATAAPAFAPGTTPPRPTEPPAMQVLEAQTRRNVQYYDQPPGENASSTTLDIYAPGGSSNPLMIFVHGGGWRNGDKAGVNSKPEAFNAAGYIFISLNYRMLPEVDVVMEAQDIARAVAWVYEHAAEFGGDAQRIFLMGHSAGCHLVSLVGTDSAYLEAEGLSLRVIKGIVALDTQAYDVTSLMDELGRNIELYQDAFGDDPEYWKKMSPLSYVAPDRGIPPFIVAYSKQGGERRARAAENFVQALQEAGVTTQLLPATDKTHTEINRQFGEPGNRVTQVVMEFLARLL